MGYKGFYSYIFEIYFIKGKLGKGFIKVIRYYNVWFLEVLYPYLDNAYLENTLVNKKGLIKINKEGNIII